MKSTSEMTKISFPFERVALERIVTLLTLGDAASEKVAYVMIHIEFI